MLFWGVGGGSARPFDDGAKLRRGAQARAGDRRTRALPLTASERVGYLFKLVIKRCCNLSNWAGWNEADVQTPQPQAGEQTRVPRSYEDGGGSKGTQPPQTTGSGADYGEGRRQVALDSTGRDERLVRDARIRLSSEIRALLERGRRKRTSNVDVFFGASPASRSRLGLIVPKHGHNIVERNKLKRRLREIGRRQVLPELDEVGMARDVLIRARRSAYGVGFDGLALEVREAVEALCSEHS